ncbi:MAG: CopG family transcriptional regulator [Akkermansiaceae bacterium]|nr:CopG family transcriptional regulator [Akkermansiaceae bacterium]
MKDHRQSAERETVVRLSISVPKENKKALEQIAEDKRVSLAWVIRDAISQYLDRSGPKE